MSGSDELSPGDLVVVVRGHECGLGAVHIIDQIVPNDGLPLVCVSCRQKIPSYEGEPLAFFGRIYCATWRLKKIKPLDELQTYRHTDENPIKVVT